jgi:ABC-type glycerol-3-phosphate transport system substrate-binding protein
MTKKLPLLLIAAVAAAGSLAACGGADNSARRPSASSVEPRTNPASRVVTVTARDFGFAPDVLAAKAGKVTRGV